MNPRDTLTIEEMAKLTGSAPEKIVALLESGEIPAKLVDGEWLVSKTGFEGWRLNSAGLGPALRRSGTSVHAAPQLTLKEAAKVLNMPQDELEELARDGMVAGFMHQGKWVFPRGALDTYLEKIKPGMAAVPKGWQSKKKSGGSGFLHVSSEQAGWPASSKVAMPSPRLLNEIPMVKPVSLELDLSILERLDVPDGPMDEEGEDDVDSGESDKNE